MPGPRDRYLPLLAALAALPADQPRLAVTVVALEALLGGPLPPTAQLADYWVHSQVARRNWRCAGWSARLDRAARTITFTRCTA